VSESIDNILKNLLQVVSGAPAQQPSEKFLSDVGKILKIKNISQMLPIPSDHMPRGTEYPVAQLPDGIG
jgi:hypothetical protein